MAIYSAGAAEQLASRNPHGTALSDHTEQAHPSGYPGKFSGVTQVQLSYTIPLAIHAAQN